MVAGPADFRRLDVAQFKSINAVAGGVWLPTSPICIGGAGLTVTGGSSFTGGARFSGGATFIQGLNDVVQLSPARTRSIVLSLLDMTIDPIEVTQPLTAGGSNYVSPLDSYLSVQLPSANVAAGVLLTNVAEAQISIPSRFLHHAGTASLASATMEFRLVARPAVPPGTTMTMAVLGLFNTSVAATPNPHNPPGLPGWQPSHAYTTGNYVQPTGNFTNAPPISYFKVLGASGTSGGTEPTWNTTPGSITTDGPLSWQCIGPNGVLFAPNIDTYFGNGVAQTLTCAFDVGASGNGDVLNRQSNRYQVFLNSLPTDGSLMLHTVTFNFVNITTMDFE